MPRQLFSHLAIVTLLCTEKNTNFEFLQHVDALQFFNLVVWNPQLHQRLAYSFLQNT